MELLPIIIEMKRVGVRVDLERAEKIKKELITKEKNLIKSIQDQSGVKDLQLWAARSLAQVFDALKLSYLRTPTGQPSFTKAFLENHTHPVASLIEKLEN